MTATTKATTAAVSDAVADGDWPRAIHEIFRAAEIRQVGYVPDAGHRRLIELVHADPTMTATVLTTEEEGIGLGCGAWLGGQRSVLLMQSSGVGNCINAFSMLKTCGFPFLTLVTMRGEWGEFNPWQVPMGQTTEAAFRLMGFTVWRAETAEDVAPTVSAATGLAFNSSQPVAVLLAQRLIGTKSFTK